MSIEIKTHMNFFLKLCIDILLRTTLKCLYIFPIKETRILFNGNCGKDFSGNPLYIYRKLLGKDIVYDMYWCIRDPQKLPSSVKYVKMYSIKMAYIALTSRVLVVDDAFPAYIPFRKKQVVLSTWHGGGAYKKVGNDLGENKILEKISYLAMKHTAIFLSTNKRFTLVTGHAMNIPLEKFWEIGMPREDILFNISEEQKCEIRKKIQLEDNQKFVLYAPTFRGYAGIDAKATNFLNIDQCAEALNKRWQGAWKVGVRYHTILKDLGCDSKYIHLTDYSDMQELLCVADVLITDYSSCMWDASLMKKPCFILAPDKDTYITQRNFYTPMEEWPYPIAATNEELMNNIVNFNEEKYLKEVHEHHKALGITETGQATELVADAIYKICYRNATSNDILRG